MPPRPCLTCGRISNGRRCPEHTITSSTARGYDAAHRAARLHLEQTLPAPCGYGCGTILEPAGPWVAAHVIDGDPTAGWIAACRSCNELAKRPHDQHPPG